MHEGKLTYRIETITLSCFPWSMKMSSRSISPETSAGSTVFESTRTSSGFTLDTSISLKGPGTGVILLPQAVELVPHTLSGRLCLAEMGVPGVRGLLTGVPDLLLEPSSDLPDGDAGTVGRGVFVRGNLRGLDSAERGALYFLLEPRRLEPPGVDGTAGPVRMLERLPMLGRPPMLGLAEPVPLVLEEWDFEWPMGAAGVRELYAVESEAEDRLRLGVVKEGRAIREGVAF